MSLSVAFTNQNRAKGSRSIRLQLQEWCRNAERLIFLEDQAASPVITNAVNNPAARTLTSCSTKRCRDRSSTHSNRFRNFGYPRGSGEFIDHLDRIDHGHSDS